MESICFNCESREFAHRIEECARNRDDVTLFGVDYTPLPVDADGVPIHVGDVMWQKDRITKRGCKAIMGDAYVMLDGIQGAVYAKGLTHYHAPTVDDVLREFAEKVTDSQVPGVHPTYEEAITEYAAKLQLRED